jgi:hypothetical protein
MHTDRHGQIATIKLVLQLLSLFHIVPHPCKSVRERSVESLLSLMLTLSLLFAEY